MKCKDVSTVEILKFLKKFPFKDGGVRYKSATTFCECRSFILPVNSIYHAFPQNVTPVVDLMRKKMGKLINKGLVDGCVCGCGGDFTITKAGIDYLKIHDVAK